MASAHPQTIAVIEITVSAGGSSAGGSHTRESGRKQPMKAVNLAGHDVELRIGFDLITVNKNSVNKNNSLDKRPANLSALNGTSADDHSAMNRRIAWLEP